MITKEKIIEVFNYYAVGSFNIEITEDNLKLFAKEIEALSKVNNVDLDDVIIICPECKNAETVEDLIQYTKERNS